MYHARSNLEDLNQSWAEFIAFFVPAGRLKIYRTARSGHLSLSGLFWFTGRPNNFPLLQEAYLSRPGAVT
ncbi:hypothetical protein BOSEA31B_20714 [Hyphomicrobiales bacterium]|nr:hypothetical protein BOSEA31B_20714 [Hyphomicrobiales bacterium]CAH1702790.1 hypothetical protein BOSEA1005_30662 [Hyphomicrobiales bacterium]CAI0346980.1 hypothetical protein BO1005MUT1_530156 [Hyphomicrobiales bacterium]